MKRFLPYILAAIVGVVYIVQMRANFDEKLDLNGDNMHYYALGRALTAGDGYTNVISPDFTPHLHFPPGYPAFISLLMHAGMDSVHAVKVANCVLLGLSLLIIFWLLQAYSVWLAAAVTMLIACHAELLHWATIMMSEMLYLTVCLLLIALVVKLAKMLDVRRLSDLSRVQLVWLVVGLIALAALAAYIYLVRTMGTSILLAAMVFGIGVAAYRRDLKPLLLTAVLALGLFASRSAWNARCERVAPGHTSDYVGDFMKKPGGQVMSTMEDWTTRVKNNLGSYTSTYLPDALFELEEPNPEAEHSAMAYIWGAILIIAIAYGLIRLGLVGWMLFLYVGATWCVLMFWPEQYAGIRYFVTVIPFLMLGICSALYGLALYIPKVGEYLAPVALLVLLIVTIPRYEKAQTYYRKVASAKRWQQINNPPMNQYLAAADWCRKNLDKDARMMSRKSEVYYMFSGYRHSITQLYYGTPEEVLADIETKRIEYVLIDWWFPHAYRTMYPTVVAYPDRFRLIQQWGQYNPQRGEYPTMLFQVVK